MVGSARRSIEMGSPCCELWCKHCRLCGSESCRGGQASGSCQSGCSGPYDPFFIGIVPTHSEIKLANSYFYDKAICTLAWKLFLPDEEFSLDHPAANPLIPGRGGLL
ncbi:hypothetical protein F2P56_000547 [Juglans regia]|uniref:Uncharacterized protein n=1 Tax=Juglans regia TaxID=51240 RepID=A0A834D376_JUGRE|nr:hypothetical protein F2P56_000547 [Juglans regia]